jgi:hypothetical protein
MKNEPDFEGSKRGRPATGAGVRVRVAPELAGRVEAWAEDNFTDFADAIRQLLERGLANEQ